MVKFGMEEYISGPLSLAKFGPDQWRRVPKGVPKVENFDKHRGIAAVFRLAGTTVYNDQGENGEKEYTVATFTHAKFSIYRHRVWV